MLLVAADSSPQTALSWIDIVSISSGVLSIIIALLAIWLSIVFYRMSDSAQAQSKAALNDVSSTTARLEKLYDRLYSDLFTMTRDTVHDMRKHMWPTPADLEATSSKTEQIVAEKVGQVKRQIEEEISTVLDRVGSFDHSLAALQNELQPVVLKAIDLTRLADQEARNFTVREFISDVIRKSENENRSAPWVTADRLVYEGAGTFRTPEISNELIRMRQEKIVDWNGGVLEPESRIFRPKS